MGVAGTPLLQAVSIDWIQWEMYVKRICVSALRFIATKVLSLPGTIQLPAPTRIFHNDLIFVGADRAPNSNLWLRRLFPDLHWALRCGQQPTGSLIALRPGGTEQRRVSILAQPHIQLLISQLSREQNVSKDSIEQRAHSTSWHGDAQSSTTSHLWHWVRDLKTLYERINLNVRRDRLFAVFATSLCGSDLTCTPIVDFLVISVLLTQMGFALRVSVRRGLTSWRHRRAASWQWCFSCDAASGTTNYIALFKEYVRHLFATRTVSIFSLKGCSRTGYTGPN